MPSTFDELVNSDPELKRRYDLIQKVGAESERGMTILAAAELDRDLEVVLKSYLVPGKARDDLFEGASPPLGSFSAKINLARALHLIGEGEFDFLHRIRKIRNEFAHNPDVRFTDERIKSWMGDMSVGEGVLDPKSKFVVTIVGLIADLETQAVHAANGRVYEESYNTFYRRGGDSDAPPFNSAEEAAAAYRAKER